MKRVTQKNLFRSIRRSLTRYIAIVAIIALGAGIFVGLRTTKSDMVATGQKYMDEQHMFDLQLLSSYGWSEAQLEAIAQLPGVQRAEGMLAVDALASINGSDKDNVYKIHAIPSRVNQVMLQGGRMPENPGECLMDGFHMDSSILGATVTISSKNEEATLDSFAQHSFTVVGYVSSPLYMDMTRGTTTLGSGTVAGFLYLPKESFTLDYYTQVDITLTGSYSIYSDAYAQAMEDAAERLEPLLEPLAEDRYAQVKLEAQETYQEGLKEYEEGYLTFLDGRREAEQELKKAEQTLLDGEQELADSRLLLEDGEKQIAEGEKLLSEKKQELADGERELKKNEEEVAQNLTLVEEGLAQIEGGLPQLEDGISQLEDGLRQLNTALNLLHRLNETVDTGIAAAQEALNRAEELGLPASVVQELRSRLDTLNEQRQEYVAQEKELQAQYDTYSRQLADLKAQRTQLEQTRQELLDNKALLEDAQAQMAEARSQLESGRHQLASAEKELAPKKEELADGWEQLAEGEKTLADGWEEFHKGKAEVEAELQDAQAELDDAWQQLEDGRIAIGEMEAPDLFLLDRNTNAGYLSLDSTSDIVKGVSTVFPAFFLLIAALVCITTMTRMVEEERTEIGTLKALGYTNWEIIRKYLAYSGSGALMGCALGVLIGSVVFPIILWEAYGIMLNITPKVVLQVDWPLCCGVVLAYTAVNLLVTWYCCRRILANVPAELIRPKAPTSGKKIFLEYLPFWKHVSFLNKVMLRNTFRYTQRLLMMFIGIGGCTALLLTGFGLRDSIVDIVSFQFSEITLYDMDVRFSQGQTPEQMEKFSREMEVYSQDVYFFHQSGIEVETQEETRDITLVSADEGLTAYMDFHYQGKRVPMPGDGEALISVGAAEMMDIEIGDRITLRNSDMREMEVTVSGIYENYVYNYIILSSATHQEGFGEAPAMQVACLNMDGGVDAHIASTQISKADGVMSVMVCQDLADQVGKMLEALNLVVATVVACAGALAVIVVYNLTNINITERIREIATIKVLGFRAGESAAYVFKENLLLSVMGAGIGLVGGRYLLMFVMSQIKVDMVWMTSRLAVPSYFLAVGLTILCSVLVDFILYFRLEKINMAEALKSVE